MASEKKVTAYLDRIEVREDDSRAAVFYVEDEEDEFTQFVLPAEFLPEDAGEGEYFTLTISREQETTQAAPDETQSPPATIEE